MLHFPATADKVKHKRGAQGFLSQCITIINFCWMVKIYIEIYINKRTDGMKEGNYIVQVGG